MDSELPSQELGPDLWPGNQDVASFMARLKKNKKKKTNKRKKNRSSTISKNKKQNEIRKIKIILEKIKL